MLRTMTECTSLSLDSGLGGGIEKESRMERKVAARMDF